MKQGTIPAAYFADELLQSLRKCISALGFLRKSRGPRRERTCDVLQAAGEGHCDSEPATYAPDFTEQLCQSDTGSPATRAERTPNLTPARCAGPP